MRFDLGSQASRVDVAGEQRIIHSVCALAQLLAWRRLRHFKRNPAIGPNMPDEPANRLFRSNVWGMVLSGMHDGDTRLPTHEPVDHVFANRSNACIPQCLLHYRCDDRHRLGTTDHRILEFIRVHSHDTQRKCACGGAKIPEF